MLSKLAEIAMLRREVKQPKADPMPRAAFLVLALALAACHNTGQTAATPENLGRELVAKTGPKPPVEGENICWADDVTPAIIETLTEQIQVAPEELGPKGEVIRAAVFETKTAQRIVQDRREVWFRAPCENILTLDFVASLQRALKARGLYTGALTGQLDEPTRRAVRRYQEPLGLNSERLSLAAARRLGIAAGDFEQ